MKELDKLKMTLDKHMELKKIYLKQGRFIEVFKCERKIQGLQMEIQELEMKSIIVEYTKQQPLKNLLAEKPEVAVGAIDRCIKLHLAADYLTKCALDVEDYLSENGIILKNITPKLKEFAGKIEKFAGSIIQKNQKYEKLMVENDTLMEALDKKMESYISQRTRTKEKNNNQN